MCHGYQNSTFRSVCRIQIISKIQHFTGLYGRASITRQIHTSFIWSTWPPFVFVLFLDIIQRVQTHNTSVRYLESTMRDEIKSAGHCSWIRPVQSNDYYCNLMSSSGLVYAAWSTHVYIDRATCVGRSHPNMYCCPVLLGVPKYQPSAWPLFACRSFWPLLTTNYGHFDNM